MTSIKINPVAARYAYSLLEVAAEKKKVDAVEKDMTEIGAMIKESADLRALLNNPLFGEKDQEAAILALAKKAKLDKVTSNFLGVLAQNRRLGALADIVVAFASALTKQRGEIAATVETASALTAAQTKKLQEHLSKTLGANVAMDVRVDKDLLGGMVVTVGSVMIDDSVRSKINRLGRAMGANQDRAA